MGDLSRAPPGGCGHPPENPPPALHCALLNDDKRRGIGLCWALCSERNLFWDLRRAPPGGCAASPRNPPRIRRGRLRNGVGDSTSLTSAPGRGRVLAHFSGEQL